MKFDDLATIPKKTASRGVGGWRGRGARGNGRRGEGRFEAAPYARSGPSRSARAEDRSSELMRPGDHDDFADSANSRSPTTPDATFLPRSPTDYSPFSVFLSFPLTRSLFRRRVAVRFPVTVRTHLARAQSSLERSKKRSNGHSGELDGTKRHDSTFLLFKRDSHFLRNLPGMSEYLLNASSHREKTLEKLFVGNGVYSCEIRFTSV